MTNIIVTDGRTPVAPETDVAARYPLGAFVAYNGTSTDGRRKRAIVIGHGDGSLELLDGADRVTVAGDDLANVLVLAVSADAYGRRVTEKAEWLGREYNYEVVARQAINELNAGVNGDPEDVHVVVTQVQRLHLRRRRAEAGTLEQQLRDRLYAGTVEFSADYFRPVAPTQCEIVITVVDAPMGTTASATGATT